MGTKIDFLYVACAFWLLQVTFFEKNWLRSYRGPVHVQYDDDDHHIIELKDSWVHIDLLEIFKDLQHLGEARFEHFRAIFYNVMGSDMTKQEFQPQVCREKHCFFLHLFVGHLK